MESLRAKFRIQNDTLRAAIAELFGTFLLVLLINSVVAQATLGPKLNQMIGINVGVGLAIVFGVAVSARLSGGHINPAVSVMALTFRQITPGKFVAYVVAQTVGAFLGAALAYAEYHNAINAYDGGVRTVVGDRATAGIFASYPAPHLGLINGFLDQVIATAVFCFLIAHITDKRNEYPTWVQPILVGTSFVSVGTAFGLNCGYPCNPARDFGPRLFTFVIGYGSGVFTEWCFIPIVAPIVGGVIGAWLYQFAIGFHTPHEEPKYEDKYVVLTANQELKPLTKETEEA